MIIALPDTTTAKISSALLRARRNAGSPAMGMVLTLLVVCDEKEYESALKAAEQQAVKNAQAIAASIEPFYGASAKDSFFKLLAGHYGAVKAYLVATVASDASAQKEATQALTSNAEDIAAFLSKANPYLPRDAVASLLLAHGGHHIQQIQQLKDRKYEAEAITWEEMKKHVYQVADATADALAKQFTKRFT